MNSLNRLAELFSKFPGIGARQARRFVFFLLGADKVFLMELLMSVEALQKEWGQCRMCFRFWNRKDDSAEILCATCADPERDTKTLMVVEKDIDLENIEKSGTYKGRYFVLGGLLPLFEKKTHSFFRENDFLTRVKEQAEQGWLSEIILALSAHPEGEHTTLYLRKALKPIAQKKALKISVLGKGLSTGTELEYSDRETIKNALESRR